MVTGLSSNILQHRLLSSLLCRFCDGASSVTVSTVFSTNVLKWIFDELDFLTILHHRRARGALVCCVCMMRMDEISICTVIRLLWLPVGVSVILGPENGEKEAEEKHHQTETDQADDCRDTNTESYFQPQTQVSTTRHTDKLSLKIYPEHCSGHVHMLTHESRDVRRRSVIIFDLRRLRRHQMNITLHTTTRTAAATSCMITVRTGNTRSLIMHVDQFSPKLIHRFGI